MKRRSNGRSNAAVAGFQIGKRTQGRRVTDDASDLSAAGCVCSLPLGWGLWLRHGLGRNQVGSRINICWLDRHFVADGELCHQHKIAAQLTNSEAAQFIASFHDFAKFHNVANFHFAAPAVCVRRLSYVTSDASTTVYRVAA